MPSPMNRKTYLGVFPVSLDMVAAATVFWSSVGAAALAAQPARAAVVSAKVRVAAIIRFM